MTWMGVCTALGFTVQTAAMAFALLSPSTLPFAIAVVVLNFACKAFTGVMQIFAACKDNEDNRTWNYWVYGCCNAVENALILCWVLDYARYCDWGVCGNPESTDFGGDLFFYYGIGIGLPLKVGLNVFFQWNMKKYYEEKQGDKLVVEDEGEMNAMLSKRGITLVVIN